MSLPIKTIHPGISSMDDDSIETSFLLGSALGEDGEDAAPRLPRRSKSFECHIQPYVAPRRIVEFRTTLLAHATPKTPKMERRDTTPTVPSRKYQDAPTGGSMHHSEMFLCYPSSMDDSASCSDDDEPTECRFGQYSVNARHCLR
jgi:hypothetical protein